MSAYLVRMFALEYIPKLKDAVFNNILKSPENNIRNMAKEKYDHIQKALDDLLKRGYSLGEKFTFMENFSIDVGKMLFKSNFLERKL